MTKLFDRPPIFYYWSQQILEKVSCVVYPSYWVGPLTFSNGRQYETVLANSHWSLDGHINLFIHPSSHTNEHIFRNP